MKLSIVATMYQSAAYIEEFYTRASASAKKLVGNDYEIILVNDGSPDNSLDLAVELAKQDENLTVVDLSRNFGHHKAMMAGLKQATGSKVFLIDSDLEEEPEWLLDFDRVMTEESCDLVYGVQARRKGGWFEKFSGWLFYKVFNWLTGLSLPKNPVTARLMTRRYLDSFLMYNEREISIGGLFLITGYKQKYVVINKHNISESTYSFGHKMVVMIDSITSFSNKPLIGIFYIGVLILLLATIAIVYLLMNWMIFSTPLSGWTSVMASIWFLGGLVVLFMGVIGIYLSRIFMETKRRPNSIVRHIYKNRGL